MTPLLAARGLTRRYGKRVAVDGLSFELARGEILGFLGPNGAGKTTTFEMLSGLRAPDSGEVRFHGELVSPTSSKLRSRLGVTFQKPSVDDKLTARENLHLGAALYGVPAREARARAERLLAAAGLEGRGDEAVNKLSGGMRRRLELARVLIHEPEILVLDEPTEGLDPAFFRSFWRQIHALRDERGLSVMLTTHDPLEADQCDRLVILDGGRVVASGTPAELKARVGGDLVTVDGDDLDEIAAVLRAAGLEGRSDGEHVLLEHPRGHEIIPRVVESFPRGRLRSVGLRPPNLGDVFVAVTGHGLETEAP